MNDPQTNPIAFDEAQEDAESEEFGDEMDAKAKEVGITPVTSPEMKTLDAMG